MKKFDENYYKELAIDTLISESFTDLSPTYTYTSSKVDYKDWRPEVYVNEDGDVYMPSEIKSVNNGENEIVDVKKIFTKEELQNTMLEIIREEEPGALDGFINTIEK